MDNARQNLQRVDSDSSSLAKSEERTFSNPEAAEQELRLNHSREDLKEKQASRYMRSIAALCVFGFMLVWSAALWKLIYTIGITHNFSYAPQVLVTLIGGTSVSVIGLTGFVIKGLFNNTNGDTQKKKAGKGKGS